ncbi:MAG: hypothetical protein CMJ18_26350 [Phycisphaeraceae bacterium]|nr:hypothetical protein [Phycisphaeraceae bacterium]
MKRPIRLPLVFAAGVSLIGCAASPRWDDRVGRKAAQDVAVSMGLVEDRALQAYVNAIGQRLARDIERPKFRYSFHLVDMDVPNAFALPGGYVYVTRGMLALANSEDELAGTIAHEIGHVEERHAASRQRAATLPILGSLPGAVVGSLVDEGLGNLMAMPFERAGARFLAGYSREQERAADRYGQRLAARAGFDPHALSTCLAGIERYERHSGVGSDTPSHLHTHPDTAERVRTTAQFASQLAWAPRPGQGASRSRYMKRIDGLIVGDNPGRGVIDNEHVAHPDLGIALTVPSGWEMATIPRQALLSVAPQRDGLFIAQAPIDEKSSSKVAQALQQALVRRGFQLGQGGSTTINGLSAYRTTAYYDGRARTRLDIACIEHESRVFTLMGMTAEVPGHDRSDAIGRAIDSFRPLTPEQRNGFTVERLRVATANEGESLLELGTRVDNTWGHDQLTALNGLDENVAFRAGQQIKYVRAERYAPKAWRK